MLHSRVDPYTPLPVTADPEDLLSSFLPHLFPDEAVSCLGEPGQTVVYASPRYGTLQIMVPAYPVTTIQAPGGAAADVETGRRLFAHYLWGGAMVMADEIERAAHEDERSWRKRRMLWRVCGERVLELGAGAALPSLIATLSHAATVTITDHPSSPALAGAIQANIAKNIPAALHDRVSVQTHEWGALPEPEWRRSSSPDGLSTNIPDTVAVAAVELLPDERKFALENRERFTRIFCADCLWMKGQHENLVRTLLWFLAPPLATPNIEYQLERECSSTAAVATANDAEIESQGGGAAWVVAGFHTGREIVASFFDRAEKMGLVVEEIWERDLNARNEDGEITREWMPVREDEGPENRARWCVIALLQRKVHREAV